MRLVLAAAVAAAIALPSTARADSPIAVIGVEIAGDAAPQLRAQLERAIRGGLESTGAWVIPADVVRSKLERETELIGCVTTACLERAGELLGADRFVRARIDATGAEYYIHVELLSRSDDAPPRRLEDNCSVCTISELRELCGRVARDLLVETPEQVAVTVATTPPGAHLIIDGKAVGLSPFSGKLDPGPHVVVARREGRGVVRRDVTIPNNQRRPMDVHVVLPPIEVIREVAPSDSFRLWKWVTAAGSVAGLATGATLIALHRHPTCADASGAECTDLYDTLLGGVIGVGVGAALGAVSGWMFFRSAAEASIAPDFTLRPEGGATGSVTIWF